MFDDITVKCPLPIVGANDYPYQTKSLVNFCDRYEIREDGTLWHEEYDTEDRSEAAKWEHENPGQKAPEALDKFIGCMTAVNQRWVMESKFTGEVRFYHYLNPGWIEWSGYFVSGQLKELHLLEHTRVPFAERMMPRANSPPE